MEMDVESFGIALGLGDEMSRGEMDNEKLRLQREAEEEEREMADLVELQMDLENETTPGRVSLLTRRIKDKPMDEFAEYLDAVLQGKIDVDWAVFNRQGI